MKNGFLRLSRRINGIKSTNAVFRKDNSDFHNEVRLHLYMIQACLVALVIFDLLMAIAIFF